MSLRTNNTDRVTILSGGNVGIGTTSSSGKLHIQASNGIGEIEIARFNYDQNWGLRLVQNYAGLGDIHYEWKHRFNTVERDLLTFKDQNVGIGTTNPQSTLHVQGNGLFTGYVKQNGIPAFYAYRSSTNLSGGLTIVFNIVIVNNTNSYNNSTGIFTAPVTGLYCFSVFGMGNNNLIYLDVQKNGVPAVCRPYENNGGTYQAASGTCILSLVVNDQVSVYLQPGTTLYGLDHNGFSGYLIG